MLGPLSLRHAAAKGDAKAQFEVAARYAEGKGIPRDFGQAATWYQRAAAQGLAPAQYRLGALYERGLGVSTDPARARGTQSAAVPVEPGPAALTSRSWVRWSAARCRPP